MAYKTTTIAVPLSSLEFQIYSHMDQHWAIFQITLLVQDYGFIITTLVIADKKWKF